MNIDIKKGSLLRVENKEYEVEEVIDVTDGEDLILLSGWGTREAYWGAEIVEGVRNGTMTILEY